MTNEDALRRAKRAIRKARDDSESFDHGGMATHEIVQLLDEALETEFRKQRS